MQSHSESISKTYNLYGPSIGDTTNPNADLPDPSLQDDEHLVADVATQQDGVPANYSQGTLQPHQKHCNLSPICQPDYDTITPVQEPANREHNLSQQTSANSPNNDHTYIST